MNILIKVSTVFSVMFDRPTVSIRVETELIDTKLIYVLSDHDVFDFYRTKYHRNGVLTGQITGIKQQPPSGVLEYRSSRCDTPWTDINIIANELVADVKDAAQKWLYRKSQLLQGMPSQR